MEAAPQGYGPLIAPMSDMQRPLRQQVFECVRAAGAISRAQIAKDVCISPASVTTLAADLIEAGFLTEVAIPREAQDGGRGRPPVALGVRADAFAVCGIKLSDHEHGAVILDFAGRELARLCAPSAGSQSLADTLSTLEHLVAAAADRAGLTPGALAGVGVGLPGLVDAEAGRVPWSPLLSGENVALAAAAEARLGLPVSLDNDANLVALAELWFGVGRRAADFAVVTVEQGVGMGLVLNHRLYRGARGLGMELGHVKVQLDGALCRCGQRGCLEAYIADYALAREASAALGRIGEPELSTPQLLDALHERAMAGDAAARSIFNRAGRYLALGLANVVNLFDPEIVILAGERMRYKRLYAEDTLADMSRLVLATGRPAPRIEVHSWGDQLWAYGAAALALAAVTERHLGAAREEVA
ncbi:ROK family protein [Roseivivax jejudonensis]|nr:ROK family protein [Roseivivax jejudonensis]